MDELRGPRSVSKLSEVPPALRVVLSGYLLHLPDLQRYAHHPEGLLRFFVEVAAPYARLINRAFPLRALNHRQVPESSKEFLSPQVANFLRFLGLAHVVGMRISCLTHQPLFVPPEAIVTLGLMGKFHRLLGKRSYAIGDSNQAMLLRLVQEMRMSAHSARSSPSDPVDVPQSFGLEHLPCVPSWTVEEITLLRAQEEVDSWVGEKYLVREKVQDANRVQRDLEHLLADDNGYDWYPIFPESSDIKREASHSGSFVSPSDLPRPMSLIPFARPSPNRLLFPVVYSVRHPRMVRYLNSMWGSHVRGLAQAVHESVFLRNIEELPEDFLKQIRAGVTIMITNMISLGTKDIDVASAHPRVPSLYVPPFATLSFAMLEKFIDLVGFVELQHAMVSQSSYLRYPVDAPGFSFDSTDPFHYGVGNHTKPSQILQIQETGRLRHRFGADFLRYDPALGPAAYKFPACPPEYRMVRTRPNTPVSEPDSDGEGEDSEPPLLCYFCDGHPHAPVPEFTLHPLISMESYTIFDASEVLARLSLSKRELVAEFYIPPEGLPRFFHLRLRPFVHEIMRAATHDFQYLQYLPSYPLAEHRRLCSWIQLLLWHLRFVVKTIQFRSSRMREGHVDWAVLDYEIPGKAFHMLQLGAFLCQFVGWTTGNETFESLQPDILLPLLEASARTVIQRRSKGEYPEYDRQGRLSYDLLLHSRLPPQTISPEQLPIYSSALSSLTAPVYDGGQPPFEIPAPVAAEMAEFEFIITSLGDSFPG
ncbi:hypothetical protein B0H19DRAFT_1055603 [Mycena capillaripes]|nr:hypothetical protein B0H19DRAFT_1055603 [Mycena capillaripes]